MTHIQKKDFYSPALSSGLVGVTASAYNSTKSTSRFLQELLCREGGMFRGRGGHCKPEPHHCKPRRAGAFRPPSTWNSSAKLGLDCSRAGTRRSRDLADPCDLTQLCISPCGEHQTEQDQLCQMAQQSMRMVLGWTAKDSTLPQNRSTRSQHLAHSTTASTSPKHY